MKNILFLIVLIISIVSNCYSQLKTKAIYKVPQELPESIKKEIEAISSVYTYQKKEYALRIREYNDDYFEIYNNIDSSVFFINSNTTEKISTNTFQHRYCGYIKESDRKESTEKYLFDAFDEEGLIILYQDADFKGNSKDIHPYDNTGIDDLGLWFKTEYNYGTFDGSSSHKCPQKTINLSGIDYFIGVVGDLYVRPNVIYEDWLPQTVNDYKEYCYEMCWPNIFECCFSLNEHLSSISFYYIIDADINPPFSMNGNKESIQWYDINESILMQSGLFYFSKDYITTYTLELKRLDESQWAINQGLSSNEYIDMNDGIFNLNTWCTGYGNSLDYGVYEISLTVDFNYPDENTFTSTTTKTFYISDCHPERTITEAISASKTMMSQTNIDATNTINTGANVIYKAAGDINLNAGFEVKPGATFQTQQGSCNY